MTAYYERDGLALHCGDCRDVLATLEAGSVQTVITSPPYFGLRDYGTAQWEGGDPSCDHMRRYHPQGSTGERAGRFTMAATLYSDVCAKCGARRIDRQIGLEPSPSEYVAALVAVFCEVWRVLRDDGTLWLNLGDAYANDAKWGGATGGKHADGLHGDTGIGRRKTATGYPPKCLMGLPWRVAFALIDDGWVLRSEIIWSKPNPMPESVTDRPTRAHEQIFLLSKQPHYWYDADAIREPLQPKTFTTFGIPHRAQGNDALGGVKSDNWGRTVGIRQPRLAPNGELAGANKRDVWTVASQPYPEAHFATFPPALIEPCILAGAPAGGVVLDPFCGAGTTGLVAQKHGRQFIGIELNSEYCRLARERLAQVALFDLTTL